MTMNVDSIFVHKIDYGTKLYGKSPVITLNVFIRGSFMPTVYVDLDVFISLVKKALGADLKRFVTFPEEQAYNSFKIFLRKYNREFLNIFEHAEKSRIIAWNFELTQRAA